MRRWGHYNHQIVDFYLGFSVKKAWLDKWL
jgi:hypothetical protein